MTLDYAYAGSTEVSKEVLESSPVEPDLVISFDEERRDGISGAATYEEYGDRWLEVESINSSEAKAALREASPDILFVMAWQELLDGDVIDIPTQGCVGRHLSLLPKRRGRAPVAWALIHGMDKTGVTLFWLDQGVDTGDIVAQGTVEIDHEDEAHDLHDKMTEKTVELLKKTLPKFESGEFPAEPQDDTEATYTHPRRPDMGLVDWERSASRLYDFIRAQTHPYPGAFTYHRMDKVKLWHGSVFHPTATRGEPGEVLEPLGENEYRVQTGEGVLDVEIENVDSNHPVEKGSVLGCTPR